MDKKREVKLIEFRNSRKDILIIFSLLLLILFIGFSYIEYLQKLIYENTGSNVSDFLGWEIASTIISLLIVFIVIVISCCIIISTKRFNQDLFEVAYIDKLTGLGNKAYLNNNSEKFLENNKSKDNYILTIDINKFRALNRIHGYNFGDELLKELAKKIKLEIDEPNVMCRVSNDIFAVLFVCNEEINEYLKKLCKNLSTVTVEGKKIKLNISIGAYKIAQNETDINTILDKSYIARSQIKGVYVDNYYIYDDKLENKFLETQKLESNMQEAIDNEEFLIYYQPKVFASSEKFFGAEALVRWKKDGEMISPRKIYSNI